MSKEEFLAKLAEFLPEASIDYDNDGQIVIYTNLMFVSNAFSDEVEVCSFSLNQ